MSEINILKSLRKRLGLTQELVAEKVGVSVNTLQNWENGGRIRNPSHLNKLMDIYGIGENLRQMIVLSIYDCDVVDISGGVGKLNYSATVDALDSLSREKDVKYYMNYPFDKIITALIVIDDRIKCLAVSLKYWQLKTKKRVSTMIFDKATALLIDAVSRDYGLGATADIVYQIQDINEKVNDIFPLAGYGGALYMDEFGEYMDYNTYLRSSISKIVVPQVQIDAKLEIALDDMRVDYNRLYSMREYVLSSLSLDGVWQDLIDLSGLVDIRHHIFWEVFTILPFGKSFMKNSSVKAMEWFLRGPGRDKVSIDRRVVNDKECMYLYCDASFYDRGVVNKALEILENNAGFKVGANDRIVSREQWIDVCKKSGILDDYILSVKD